MPILAATLICSAFLLFLVQPLMGAFVLPWFGGAPAVWTTCMLFFQTLLLGGYAYAHGLARRPLRQQAVAHGVLVLVAVLALPIGPDAQWMPTDAEAPIARILALLTVNVGLPYLVLSSTSTLIQAWAARLFPGSPYRLYAWSNAASLAALFAYPLVLAPLAGARDQALGWSWAFGLFAALSWGSALFVWRRGGLDAQPAAARHRPGARAVLTWLGLSALPSALLLAVTEQITADVSVVPFFWVLPLALYLLTFMIAFAQARLPSPARVALAAGLGLVCFVPGAVWPGLPLVTQVGLGCGGLFLVVLALHTELVRRRPPPEGLTGFYLALSVGGALGGGAVALLAPAIFNQRMELPVLWVLSAVALILLRPRAAWLLPLAVGGVVAAQMAAPVGTVLERRRSFYGTLRVEEQPAMYSGLPAVLHLVDGRVSHGFQVVGEPERATGYYAPNTGVGRALAALPGPRRVGLIGLGSGTLAAYGRAGDVFRFYELNPDVIAVARERFTFLRHSAATIEVRAGDARQSLALEPDQGFDLLVLDAFSGDAVPVHLLTAEAFELWRRHLKPGGILAMHLSNHHLDLTLLAHGQVAALGWTSHWIRRRAASPLGPFLSQWTLAGPAATMAKLGFPQEDPPSVADGLTAPRWTDDHSPLRPLLR